MTKNYGLLFQTKSKPEDTEIAEIIPPTDPDLPNNGEVYGHGGFVYADDGVHVCWFTVGPDNKRYTTCVPMSYFRKMVTKLELDVNNHRIKKGMSPSIMST